MRKGLLGEDGGEGGEQHGQEEDHHPASRQKGRTRLEAHSILSKTPMMTQDELLRTIQEYPELLTKLSNHIKQRNEQRNELLRVMQRQRPGLSLAKLAKHLGWSKIKVWRTMKTLVKARLVTRRRSGRYILSETGEKEAL